jgi:prepilin-type N-terminal cleavage/methylation domain-containing protein
MVKLNENSAYKRGQELLDAGQYEEAIERFAEVIEENPRAWKAMNSQGFAYQKMSKYTDAVDCFDKALAVNPKSVEVLNNKGVTLVELIVAIAILSVAIIPLMYAFVNVARFSGRGREVQRR